MPLSRGAVAWLAGLPAGVLLVLCTAAALAVHTATGRAALLKAVAARTHHSIDVHGALEWHIASRQLRVHARDVAVGNPDWMPPGQLARLGSVTLSFGLSPWHLPRLRAVELHDGLLQPSRKADGKANWTRAPSEPAGAQGGLPPLRSLILDGIRIRLQDERRRLDFDGAVTTKTQDDGRFQLDARGRLNGRDMQMTVTGAALASLQPGAPWPFDLVEESSGTRLTASGALAHPLALHDVDATFESRGSDLRDLYYLVGVRLPDTGRYTLKGRFARNGTRFEFRDLDLASGGSDLTGRFSAVAGKRVDADLHSRVARVRDIGRGAAGRAEPGDGPPRLFADWKFPLRGLRARDARIRYRADSLQIGRLTVREASLPIRIEDGVLIAEHLHARTDHGEAQGSITFDARTERPRATLRLSAEGIELAELLHKDSRPAAVTGPLGGKLELEGIGESPHALFGSSSGRLQLRLPSGELRATLAQALGLDLRALGLSLAHADDRVPVRCALLDARITDGRLQADPLVIDTQSVVLTGTGTLAMDTEALDVTLTARPKRAGLRLRTPLHIEGRLLQPSPRLEARSIGRQGAAAAALGILVAPVAAAAAFLDPGRARDVDCAALLAPSD
jgi:AsmA family protein